MVGLLLLVHRLRHHSPVSTEMQGVHHRGPEPSVGAAVSLKLSEDMWGSEREGRVWRLGSRVCGMNMVKSKKRTSASCACEAMTSSFAAGCTTSISRMIVAASEVTKSLPRWLITSLLRPRIHVCTDGLGKSAYTRRTVWPKACPDQIRELGHSLDIP